MVTSRIRLMSGWTPASAGPGSASQPQEQVCVANIDTAGRRQRLMAGVIELVFGLGILGVMLAVHADPLWRLPLFLVFWGAAIGFFQWRERT
jgi:hypothetical protein